MEKSRQNITDLERLLDSATPKQRKKLVNKIVKAKLYKRRVK